jgi:hypothetical protein
MLTESALRNLKPRTALYKIVDRDGMYSQYLLRAPFLFDTTTALTGGEKR